MAFSTWGKLREKLRSYCIVKQFFFPCELFLRSIKNLEDKRNFIRFCISAHRLQFPKMKGFVFDATII